MADDHHSTTAPPPDLPPISPNSPPPEHQETPPPPENQETSPPPHPATDQETTPPPPPTTTIGDVIDQPEKPTKTPEPMPSFKEESNQIKDLSPSQQNSLQDFKTLIQQAITNQDFTFLQNQNQPISQLSIWGIPIFQDDRTDVVLLKFLRARDFKVQDSFTMFKDTLQWRKTFDIESLLEENLGDDLEKVVFNHGFDKEGHPVCYNVYGEFQNKELYNKMFSDNEGRLRFLRWRIQYLERSIRKLDFRPGGVNTIFQISDLKNSPGPAKRELRLATRQALQILQDNYPEFVAKQVFINAPWWYLAFYTMISPFMTQRTKSKFVFASTAKTPETLFKYVNPEHVPIQYGGLSVDYCDCNPEFTIDDPASVVTVKPATKQTVEIIVNEKCLFVWELRVVGWEVSYSAEYVPNNESHYTIIIQKARKMTPTDEPVISHSFKISELGKILLTIDNPTSKKKTLLYRFKVCPLSE
ncbi:putative CRAL-TRIO lipid binding domain, GOLD domain, CRAL/TRIO domain, CRAL/TRIO domain superfamily [Helianthus annuus]|nr:putative CRAL-TRIO lipid binding domain, GOLD domain, CRAL/TRIO domain, CRAL/TRIO domain superfamily [Helianthus annuus]